MPFFTTTVEQDTSVLRAIREVAPHVPEYAAQVFRDDVQVPLQAEASRLLAVEPGPVQHPFEFATPKSRRAYFATNGFGKGVPYKRDGSVTSQWVVRLDRRSFDTFLTLRNDNPASAYVYGPGNGIAVAAGVRQAPGHFLTGWGRDLPQKLDQIVEYSVRLTLGAWDKIVTKVLETR